MTSYAHTKIIEAIKKLDRVPDDKAAFSEWIKGGAHFKFLKQNGASDEVVVFASGPYTFVHSLIVPNSQLVDFDRADILKWSSNPYTSIASYATGGGEDGLWIERENHSHGTRTLQGATDLIFARTFEGWPSKDRSYIEVNQEYTHLAEIHWRPELKAYCRWDDSGDLQKVVSIDAEAEGIDGVRLATFLWEPLQDYLAAADASLVQMFDLTLLRHGDFSSWGDGPESHVDVSDTFFYRQKITGNAAYARGVQILSIRRAAEDIMADVVNGWTGTRDKKYVEYIAKDWRNDKVVEISTDPAATTNYFEAEGNTLPFELSPAFFKPEVLSKYKTDRDKYTIGERTISCRTAWSLKGYDVNEANQVHAYICDLRRLPYNEQLHWRSFNEAPKAEISERAITNDFRGEWVMFETPLQEVLSILRSWQKHKFPLWNLRDVALMTRVAVPLTASREEWANAHMDLSKLIAEGFEVKTIRNRLTESGIAFEEKDGSIVLLERLLQMNDRSISLGLQALRTMQTIRSKVAGHAGSSEGVKIIEQAIKEFGSLTAQFEKNCTSLADELRLIEAMNP